MKAICLLDSSISATNLKRRVNQQNFATILKKRLQQSPSTFKCYHRAFCIKFPILLHLQIGSFHFICTPTSPIQDFRSLSLPCLIFQITTRFLHFTSYWNFGFFSTFIIFCYCRVRIRKCHGDLWPWHSWDLKVCSCLQISFVHRHVRLFVDNIVQ